MAKLISDDALDAALQYIIDNVSHIHVLSQIPTAYADVATYTLGNTTLVSGDFGALGDFTSGGRQIAIPQKTVTGTAAGTVTYLALIDSSETELLVYSDTVSQAITNGGSLVVPTWLIYIEDPT